MLRRPKIMNVGNMISNTEWAKRRVNDWLDLADMARKDSRKEDRLARHECIGCFYGVRIGGAAITQQPCMCCNVAQTYTSTATDALCMDCAKEHSLCKRCGGDLDMK